MIDVFSVFGIKLQDFLSVNLVKDHNPRLFALTLSLIINYGPLSYKGISLSIINLMSLSKWVDPPNLLTAGTGRNVLQRSL
jgi:hypothetical protein